MAVYFMSVDENLHMFWILTKYVRELELQGIVRKKFFSGCVLLTL